MEDRMRRCSILLAVLALCPGPVSARGQEAGTPKKILFAIGGWKSPKDALPLLRYFVGLTGKPNPKVCLLPTAMGDSSDSIVSWYDLMNQLECRPRHLRLFQPSKVDSFEDYLLDMDAIYVGGGNTLNMLAIWKEQGVDKILQKALKKGIVLGGGSAGAICWFEQACTDSRPGKLSAIDGLGWLPGSACPHFDLEKRRAAYPELVLAGNLKDGLACDEGAGILFEDDKLVRVVRSLPKATAWTVKRQNGKIDLSALESQFLGK
jgi:peptidase E